MAIVVQLPPGDLFSCAVCVSLLAPVLRYPSHSILRASTTRNLCCHSRSLFGQGLKSLSQVQYFSRAWQSYYTLYYFRYLMLRGLKLTDKFCVSKFDASRRVIAGKETFFDQPQLLPFERSCQHAYRCKTKHPVLQST
jgi:hypothetical protein